MNWLTCLFTCFTVRTICARITSELLYAFPPAHQSQIFSLRIAPGIETAHCFLDIFREHRCFQCSLVMDEYRFVAPLFPSLTRHMRMFALWTGLFHRFQLEWGFAPMLQKSLAANYGHTTCICSMVSAAGGLVGHGKPLAGELAFGCLFM